MSDHSLYPYNAHTIPSRKIQKIWIEITSNMMYRYSRIRKLNFSKAVAGIDLKNVDLSFFVIIEKNWKIKKK
jgi:hypothetical protein